MAPVTLSTGAVLRVAKLDAEAWYDACKHNLFRDLPRLIPGRQRRFDRDDLLCVTLYAELLRIGLTRQYAARIASDVREVLRLRAEVETLAIVKGTDAAGLPCPQVVLKPAAGALVLFQFSIGKMRAAAELAFAEHLN